MSTSTSPLPDARRQSSEDLYSRLNDLSSLKRAYIALTANVVHTLQTRLLSVRANRHAASRCLEEWNRYIATVCETAILRGFSERHLLGTNFDAWQNSPKKETPKTKRPAPFERAPTASRVDVDGDLPIGLTPEEFQELEDLRQRYSFEEEAERLAELERVDPVISRLDVLHSPTGSPLRASPATPRPQPQKLQSADAVMASTHARSKQTRWALDRWLMTLQTTAIGRINAAAAAAARRREVRSSPYTRRSAQPEFVGPEAFDIAVFRLRSVRNATIGAMRKWELEATLIKTRKQLCEFTADGGRLMRGLRGLAWNVVEGRARDELSTRQHAAALARLHMRGRWAMAVWRRRLGAFAALSHSEGLVAHKRWLNVVHSAFTQWYLWASRGGIEAAALGRVSAQVAQMLRACSLARAWEQFIQMQPGSPRGGFVAMIRGVLEDSHLVKRRVVRLLRIQAMRARYTHVSFAHARQARLLLVMNTMRTAVMLSTLSRRREGYAALVHVRSYLRSWLRHLHKPRVLGLAGASSEALVAWQASWGRLRAGRSFDVWAEYATTTRFLSTSASGLYRRALLGRGSSGWYEWARENRVRLAREGRRLELAVGHASMRGDQRRQLTTLLSWHERIRDAMVANASRTARAERFAKRSAMGRLNDGTLLGRIFTSDSADHLRHRVRRRDLRIVLDDWAYRVGEHAPYRVGGAFRLERVKRLQRHSLESWRRRAVAETASAIKASMALHLAQ